MDDVDEVDAFDDESWALAMDACAVRMVAVVVVARIAMGAVTVTKARRVVMPPEAGPSDVVLVGNDFVIIVSAAFATVTANGAADNGNDNAAVLPMQQSKNFTTRRRETNFMLGATTMMVKCRLWSVMWLCSAMEILLTLYTVYQPTENGILYI